MVSIAHSRRDGLGKLQKKHKKKHLLVTDSRECALRARRIRIEIVCRTLRTKKCAQHFWYRIALYETFVPARASKP